MKIKDITGLRFTKLLVIRKLEKAPEDKRTLWECLCDCGKIFKTPAYRLTGQETKSCGCYRIEQAVLRSTKHGLSHTSEYKVWATIKSRCLNPLHDDYHHYGGRGITISKSWSDSFESFIEDMGPRPSPKHSIERRDNSFGYSKNNCYWATSYEQVRNKRNNVWIEHNGEKLILKDWATKLNTDDSNIKRMLKTRSFSEVYEYYTQNNKK